MFYTFLPYLLWSLLSWHHAAPQTPRTLQIAVSATAGKDTLIRQKIEDRLRDYNTSAQPEKCYLHTDRTLYYPGESLWFNAYLREAGSLQPSETSQVLYVQLCGPNGNSVGQHAIYVTEGTAPGDFWIDANWPGGIYKLKAWTNWMLNSRDTFVKNITVQKTVLPNLNLKLEFEKKGYGPGDEVEARVDLQGLDNQYLVFEKITFTADADGEQFTTGVATTDVNGRAMIRFRLPVELKSNDGLLNVQVMYKGQPEAISRAIPIVLNKVALNFFPEGGNAVAGLPCRMAFKAMNEFGKPADVSGYVTDQSGSRVGEFSSFHNGMGAFDFTPKKGGRYKAQITSPFWSEQQYELPAIENEGVVLQVVENLGKTMVVKVLSSKKQTIHFAATAQDSLFFYKEITATEQGETVRIPVEKLPPGIVKATVFNQKMDALAERLAFVNRDKGLHVDITPDKGKYLPREKVNLKVKVTDHAGKPVQGRFSLAVSDETNLTYADDKQANILAALLLEQDVKGKIEEPNFYFDEKEPKSLPALDHLLMTQGWRRFVWKETGYHKYQAEKAGFAGRIVKSNGKPLADKKIKLIPDGPTTRTDANGYFIFAGIEMQQYQSVEAGKVRISINDRWYPYNYFVTPTHNTPDPTGKTFLSGKVTDPDPAVGELIGASVKVMRGNQFVRGGITDINGDFRISLDPGTYNVEISYTGYPKRQIEWVTALSGEINQLNVEMSADVILDVAEMVGYKVPLIKQDQTASGTVLTSDQIKNLPTRKVNAIVSTTAGTSSIDGDAVTIKGSRANGTNYFVDGIRVYGGNTVPVQDIEDLDVVIGGLGAEFGNYTHSGVQVVSYNIPLIRADDMSTGATYYSSQILPSSFQKSGKSSVAYVEPNIYLQVSSRQLYRARQFYAPQYAAADPSKYYPTTLYWNPAVVTDKDGEAAVSFTTSDAVTNFRVTVEGAGVSGLIGHGEKQFFTQKLLNLDTKIPPYAVTGDTLQLQVSVTNNSDAPVYGAFRAAVGEGLQYLNPISEKTTIKVGETKIIPVAVAVNTVVKNTIPTVYVGFSDDNGRLEDFRGNITVLERGFPVQQVSGGNTNSMAFDVNLSNPVPRSVSVNFTAYPSPLSDLVSGMERMLRQPCGCFEQVSSANYPNLLVLDLLKSTGNAQPETEARARQFLADGYKRLSGYECKTGGFDWHGNPPGNETLTAYGILEFTDMKKVFDVDQAMIDRSVAWLKTRTDGKGGWQPGRTIYSWDVAKNPGAYIAWAMSEAGYADQILPEVNAAYEKAMSSGDLYQIALMANTFLNMKDPRAVKLMDILVEKQNPDGSWTGLSKSAMNSTGKYLNLETTSLATLAFLKAGKPVDRAIQYIASCKSEYGFGSTQSTVLALRALVEYAKSRPTDMPGNNRFCVQVDGKTVAEKTFTKGETGKIDVKGLEQYFVNSNPKITVLFDNENQAVPYDLEVKYTAYSPQNPEECPITFQTKMAKTAVKAGETLRMTATLSNTTKEDLASPIMILAIPAGLSLQPWQLKQLSDEKQCDYYEIWNNQIVFYFRGIAAGETRTINLDLRADIPGSYESPASQAYLYYSNEHRVWSRPERVTIAATENNSD